MPDPFPGWGQTLMLSNGIRLDWVGGEQYQQSTSGGRTYWTLWPANSQQWAFNTNVLFSFNPDTSGDDFYFDPTTFLFISSDHFENNGQTITVPALGPSYSWKSGSMFGYIDSEPFWTTSKGFSDANGFQTKYGFSRRNGFQNKFGF